MSLVFDRLVSLGRETIYTFHPSNFIKQAPSAIRRAASAASKLQVIHNSPTKIVDAATAATKSVIGANINDISSSTLQNINLDQVQPLNNFNDWIAFLQYLFKSPSRAINSTFTIPPNFVQSVIILTITMLIIAIILDITVTFFKKIFVGPRDFIPIQIQDVAVFDGFKPHWRVSNDVWLSKASARFQLHEDETKFMMQITHRSGIGYATHFPASIVELPADLSLSAARAEAEVVMFHCIDRLLADNNVKPEEVDILVTNCSLFNPTPSIPSMIINHYKFRSDIQSFHLGGMGCGISPLSVNLASSCLRLHEKKHPIAIVVSMENITQNIYCGRDRAFMLQNALFRLGGAAVMLTRDTTAVLGRPAPKWTIEHSTHVHTAANTDAYACVFQDIDREDRQGVRLDKALLSVAAGAITRNLSIVGPKILPLTAKLDYVYRLGLDMVRTQWKKLIGHKDGPGCKSKVIVPDFRLAVQHFCVHAGGRAVLTGIQDSLNLTDADMKPSRDTLYKYGNTSSSSIWYEYSQIEMTRQPKKDDRMLMIAVGSGFKANLLTVKALRDIKPRKHVWGF
jgi:3-ketoacyl-CoA synthase